MLEETKLDVALQLHGERVYAKTWGTVWAEWDSGAHQDYKTAAKVVNDALVQFVMTTWNKDYTPVLKGEDVTGAAVAQAYRYLVETSAPFQGMIKDFHAVIKAQ